MENIITDAMTLAEMGSYSYIFFLKKMLNVSQEG